jgi:predicted transcriptional regulator
VEHIQHIAALLTNPPTVIPLFQKTVFTLDDSSSVSSAVKMMFDNNISQLPIRLSDSIGENIAHVPYFRLSHIHDYVTYSAIGAHAMGLRGPNRVP